MMTGGRILGHAPHYLPIETTRLFFVGYQGEGTMGRWLLEGNKTLTIDGVSIPVKASVNDTQTMSSHADQKRLVKWLQHIKGVEKVFLTHGEDGPRAALAKKITEDLGRTDITMPTLHQEVSL